MSERCIFLYGLEKEISELLNDSLREDFRTDIRCTSNLVDLLAVKTKDNLIIALAENYHDSQFLASINKDTFPIGFPTSEITPRLTEIYPNEFQNNRKTTEHMNFPQE